MCGIAAVSGVPEAAKLVFLALYSLQHRGQEAAGIVSVEAARRDGARRIHKGTGLVSDAFDEARAAGAPGDTAIGHIRYSTAGGAGLHNAQPLLVRYSEGDLALAHNGNLTNAQELRGRLVAEGALFQSTIDSEVIVHLIARSRRDGVDAQIDDALSQLEGAFSAAHHRRRHPLRRPRPARLPPAGARAAATAAIVVASETCALDIVGRALPARRRARRGAADPRRRDDARCGPLVPSGAPAPCVFELVYFARPDSRLWGQSVDRARRAFGRQLALEQPAEADCVIAVPDSANSAALGFAEASGIPFELGLIRNHYVGRTFIEPSQAGRNFKVRLKYSPVREVLEGKRVVVVDDSLVRGTTSRGLVAAAARGGRDGGPLPPRLARPCATPASTASTCPRARSSSPRTCSPSEIRDHLGVDSLGYLSLEGMLESVAESGTFCSACFSGDYPTPLVDLARGYAVGVGA